MLQQSFDLALESGVGPGGIPDAAFEKALADLAPALARLKGEAEAKSLPLLGLPSDTADLPPVHEAAKRLREGATDILVLGTGGSSLGGQTLAQLTGYGTTGLSSFLPEPRVHFIDNLDPLTYEALLKKLPLKTTKFVSISKSGGTGETLLQTIAAITALRGAGIADAGLGWHFQGLSEPARPGKLHALRALLEPFGTPFLDHHTGVGGRYSVLTNCGLLPAAALGLNIEALRTGAAKALAPLVAGKGVREVPAALGAALHLAAMRSGKGIAVLMPYADKLALLTRWWVQLWAESLGKDGKGTQPVGALGPVDQHSQQQLYLGGPRDKFFTVLTVGAKGKGPKIDAALASVIGDADFAGKTIGDLVAAQGVAMVDTFAKNGCSVRRFHVDHVDETVHGEILMHFMLETILTGYAMGVDPFDQPAVEEAKLLAKRYLAEGRG
ncbi:glucose-6-phosphate isomerase [Bosea caraganae]|uniref:Glucose-6-phosphate isomerase n=1 Tax=Bosea caraganae TaxID=2763117 RepID=A0A370L4C4_9HYPH|nr:glucose-6-phosphate isomerase [Bosea caraganae]RDJ22384.1 glucose-6-phosphate isomerase [Bosea caraganae]RDJ23682.1 glucose-6-phosphate isomerase [Bosea caraganae]